MTTNTKFVYNHVDDSAWITHPSGKKFYLLSEEDYKILKEFIKEITPPKFD